MTALVKFFAVCLALTVAQAADDGNSTELSTASSTPATIGTADIQEQMTAAEGSSTVSRSPMPISNATITTVVPAETQTNSISASTLSSGAREPKIPNDPTTPVYDTTTPETKTESQETSLPPTGYNDIPTGTPITHSDVPTTPKGEITTTAIPETTVQTNTLNSTTTETVNTTPVISTAATTTFNPSTLTPLSSSTSEVQTTPIISTTPSTSMPTASVPVSSTTVNSVPTTELPPTTKPLPTVTGYMYTTVPASSPEDQETKVAESSRSEATSSELPPTTTIAVHSREEINNTVADTESTVTPTTVSIDTTTTGKMESTNELEDAEPESVSVIAEPLENDEDYINVTADNSTAADTEIQQNINDLENNVTTTTPAPRRCLAFLSRPAFRCTACKSDNDCAKGENCCPLFFRRGTKCCGKPMRTG